MANPDKAHHQGRSHPLLYGEPACLFRGLPGSRGRRWGQRGRPERRVSRAVRARSGAGDLRQVRRVTARWAARAEDFVIAVREIAADAARYGSPAALLRVAGGAAQAEVRDGGCWRAGRANGAGRRRAAGAVRCCA